MKLISGARKNSWKSLLYALLSIGCIPVSFILGGFSIWPFIAAVFFLVLASHFFTKYKTWGSGARGERKVSKHLKPLKQTHTIINDLMLPGLYGNIDHVIIGENGIFVLETKNHNGRITCDGDNWYREKIGQQGTVYEAKIGNPSKQVKGNALALKKIINKKYQLPHDFWIHGIVVFAHDEAEIIPQNPTVPILRPQDIPEYIYSFDSGNSLMDFQVQGIANVLSIK